MQLGGVILGAGMQLNINSADYLHGDRPVCLILKRVVCQVGEWVILEGQQQPTPTTPWRPRRLQVRIAALARSLAL